ncbi:hypothetical protein Hs30E_08910 [Lactococcus hodotermopsidis]|uniref:DUF2969 domain-containing protein n=1 Tax=Pseudolactococcus hodotermopsidis TaxID=2709157 RepID=A0A6A0BA58_9LACT|nr:DUF2969 family protein [Lactococcus hodotermopsidis]GFH42340.1 hypothetical protein Hs30E_08910 [Lactococcus hodotermopsidis]
MSKKKETEIQISDSKDGVILTVGKKKVAEIKNITDETTSEETFEVLVNGKYIKTMKNYPEALEEAIKTYNLAL